MSEKLDFRDNPPTDFEDVGELTESQAEREIDALREGIEFHDQRYYVENRPVISDAVYDKLFHRLEELEQAFPGLRSDDSPTQRVGGEPLDELERVEHAAPMLSLNATTESDEIESFLQFVRGAAEEETPSYVSEPKFDGVSVEVVYHQGRFHHGATRGDGRVGDDVSENLKTIRSLPLRLKEADDLPERLAVRGEVFLPREAFQELNQRRIQQDEEPYANARNATAGILRRLESKLVARYPLDIIFYDVMSLEGDWPETHWDELQRFKAWGLKTDPHSRRCEGLEAIRKFHRELEDERERLAFEIDGVVIKVDSLPLWQQLGTRHRSPRWAIAWKFPPRQEITTLEKIVVQVGRTGKLTPVALLRPVDVGGVTVSRATLHNESEVQKKDVRPGDRVRIVRAGDVIPEVLERVKQPGKARGEPFQMPDHCPVCGTQVEREGAYHFCPAGLTCQPQLIGRITHFASRAALDIDELGEETARQLVDRKLVGDLADLYELDEGDLRELEGFAEKLAKKLHQSIQDAKRPTLDRFLYGLGIRHVGERVARMLAQEFQTLDRIRRAGLKELEQLAGIGPEIAHSVVRFFDREENARVLDRMKRLGVEVQPMPQAGGDRPLEGETFVFTGELEGYTRDEAKRAVERLGGRATSSVSGQTDYVVAGEDPGSKLDEARKRGTEILDEGQFRKRLNDS